MEQYLVFDIETAPIPWENFSESQQEYLLRKAQSEEEIEQKKFEMALSPLTSTVVCIGLQLMELEESGVWSMINKAAFSTKPGMEGDDLLSEELESGDKCYIASEKKILQDFWIILTKYSQAQLVSFNGRGFDAPFLMLRSALLGLRPSRNLMAGTKFNYPMHIDLADELTFFQPSGFGATKRYNFDFYTRAFGIKSPKSEGVDGSMVGKLYNEGEVLTIAEYCLRDITATWELFLTWRNLLRF